ncbi:hypothetical protein COL516b_005249 [Colletotrichum fioriniae]|nr:uncharacterized protein COL516b_005249 [Colletotrichum fioriniae]KAJ0305553.1 hypothetical protein COL516b_005249 [Colletotrichum fioriniae]
MGFFRRIFAFLEEGPHHASSKSKPSRNLVKAAVALNKMGRKPSCNSSRDETVVSNSLVTIRGHASTCERSSESISHHSVPATNQIDGQLGVLDGAIDFESEKQLAIRILNCRDPSIMSLSSSIEPIIPERAHEAV